MEGRDILVEIITQKGTRIELRDQEIITTGIIIKITKITRN